MTLDKLVKAVLYEGYILYPYRLDSTKNRHRFTFGRVYPRDFAEAKGESFVMQTQCLLEYSGDATLTITARFLHPMKRIIAQAPDFRPVPELRVDGRVYQTWQEATEQTVTLRPLDLNDMPSERFPFSFPASQQQEPIHDDAGQVVGGIERQQYGLEGVIEVMAESLGDGLCRVTVRVQNETPLESAPTFSTEDDAVLMRTFASAHTILSVSGGAFVSLLDPPDEYTAAVAACENIGVFPVLVGDHQHDTLFASPIILYDYPEIAPESQGDLFDSTEIDEMLTLRIMTMTDAEKAEMRQVDERARQILQRTESMQPEDLLRLHGTRRSLRTIEEDDQ